MGSNLSPKIYSLSNSFLVCPHKMMTFVVISMKGLWRLANRQDLPKISEEIFAYSGAFFLRIRYASQYL